MQNAPAPFNPADVPTEVRLARDGTRVTLAWTGAEGSASAGTLRAACRCAWCTRARIEGNPPCPTPDVAIAEFRPLGNFAVHIAFTDGHRKGVFPWTFLRSLACEPAAPVSENIA